MNEVVDLFADEGLCERVQRLAVRLLHCKVYVDVDIVRGQLQLLAVARRDVIHDCYILYISNPAFVWLLGLPAYNKFSMHTNTDITTSNLTSVRRAPPLPGKPIAVSPLLNSKHLERTTNPQHQPLSFTKKTSQVSLNHQIDRRRSIEHNGRPPVELVESSANVPPQSHRLSNYRNNTCVEINITNDLLQILKDENRNLKDQNTFLLTKIRQINENQKALKEAVLQYEVIVNHLTDENQELKQENRQLTQIASRKVNEFGNKLAELMTENAESESQPAFKYRSVEPTFQQYQSIGASSQYYSSNSQQAQYSMPPVPPKPTKADISTQPNDSQMDELNNQFEALIYSCRVEKNLEKRKQIRKQLVELTYRMRELKK